MREQIYSIKWDVQFSVQYAEYLLNLAAQGYFEELWQVLNTHVSSSIQVFAEEIHNNHYIILGNLVDGVIYEQKEKTKGRARKQSSKTPKQSANKKR